MPRIIPEELNKKIRKEYRFRFFTLLFFMLSSAIIASILLVSSSYLLLSLYEKAYTTGDSLKRNEELSKVNQEYNSKLSQVYALSQKIPLSESNVDIKIAHILFEYALEGIELNTIEISSEAKISKLVLRGNASTRDNLLGFQEKIKQDSRFNDFSIPIESLAKQKDISFNVTFTYHEK